MAGYIPNWEDQTDQTSKTPRPKSTTRNSKPNLTPWLQVCILIIVAVCVGLLIVDSKRFALAWVPVGIFVWVLISVIRVWFNHFSNAHPVLGFLMILLPILGGIGGCIYHQNQVAAKKARWESVLEQRRKEEAAKRAEDLRRTEIRREELRKKWASLEQPLPASGRVRMFRSDIRNSPFEIKSYNGANYLLKLVDLYTKEAVMTVFVRGGTTTEVDVPSGTFEIRYASGTTWYGDDLLFGPETTCSKANQSFSFVPGTGFTITLYKVQNGNLTTSSISPAEF